MRLLSFGSGSSGNCYLLSASCGHLIIDMGIGLRTLRKYFSDYGLHLTDIRAALLTHDHADHAKSIGSLAHDMFLSVYATRKVFGGIDGNYVIKRKVAQELRKYITNNESFDIEDFHITPFHVPHDSHDNVGYRIECEGVVLVIVTDAGSVTEEMQQYIAQADYLLIEANHDEQMVRYGRYPAFLKQRILSDIGHMSNSTCGHTIAKCHSPHLRHVMLCHLSQDNNNPEKALDTIRTILQQEAPHLADMPVTPLNRTRPTGWFDMD